MRAAKINTHVKENGSASVYYFKNRFSCKASNNSNLVEYPRLQSLLEKYNNEPEALHNQKKTLRSC